MSASSLFPLISLPHLSLTFFLLSDGASEPSLGGDDAGEGECVTNAVDTVGPAGEERDVAPGEEERGLELTPTRFNRAGPRRLSSPMMATAATMETRYHRRQRRSRSDELPPTTTTEPQPPRSTFLKAASASSPVT
jgi:hypothetical protein